MLHIITQNVNDVAAVQQCGKGENLRRIARAVFYMFIDEISRTSWSAKPNMTVDGMSSCAEQTIFLTKFSLRFCGPSAAKTTF